MKSLKQLRWSLLLLLVMMLVPNKAWADGYTITLLTNYDPYNNTDLSEYLFDGDPSTKWCTELPSNVNVHLIIKISEQVRLQSYELVDAADSNHKYYGRHWNSWKILGANFSSDADAVFGSSDWVEVDSQNNQAYTDSLQASNKNFTVNSTTAYQYYMLRLLSAGESANAVWDDYECEWNAETGWQQMADMNFTFASAACSHDYQNGICSLCHENEAAEQINDESSSFNGYYAIDNAGKLAWFADKVVTDSANFAAAKVVLTANIDLSSYSSWTPIGTQAKPFKGTFDGQDHSIDSVKMNATTSYYGLFGHVQKATLTNFSVSGKLNVAKKVGQIGGIVGAADGTTLTYLENNVSITVPKDTVCTHIGGIVGGAFSDNGKTYINHCANNAIIDAGASNDCIGGIVGYYQGGKIEYCLNAGAVKTTGSSNAYVGGILGYTGNNGFYGINYSLNTGQITAGADTYKGAIWGRANISADGNTNYYLQGTANKGLASSKYSESAGCNQVSSSQLPTGDVAYKLNGSKSTGTLHWYQKLGTDTIPTLKLAADSSNIVYTGKGVICGGNVNYSNYVHNYENDFCTRCGNLEVVSASNRFGITNSNYDGWYAIKNAEQLKWFAEKLDADYNNFKKANVVLVADIDLSTISNWAPIGTEAKPYCGIFDGQSHSIDSMKIKGFATGYQGLFGRTLGATLKNFAVSGTMTSSNTGATGVGYGGVVGSAEASTLKNIVSNVNITIAEGKKCSHIGGVAGRTAVSGSLGTKISNCVYNGTLDAGASTDCIGGIAGYYQAGKIEYCLNEGAVKTTGSGAYIGGILGYTSQNSFEGIFYCLNTAQITAGSDSKKGAIWGLANSATNNSAKGDHNYYLKGTALKGTIDKGLGDFKSSVSAFSSYSVTSAQLKSGEVAYKLNGSKSTGTNWYQRLGEAGDSYPVLTKASDGSNIVYYGYDICYLTYANSALSATASDHDFSVLSAADANGLKKHVCAHCQYEDPDTRVIENFNNGNNLELKLEGANYTAGDVTITDGALAQFGVNFKAKSVTYNRSLEANTGKYSFIVPFNIDATKMAELGTFYQFDRVESSENKVYFASATSVEANKAYFFLPEQNITSIEMADSTVICATSGVDATSPSASGLYGTYQQVDVPEGAYGYVENAGAGTFVKAGTGNKINPFRAYLWLDGSSMSNALAIFGFVDEEATAIDAIEEENGSAVMFNLNGQRIASPRQGGMYIQNNKIIIKK